MGMLPEKDPCTACGFPIPGVDCPRCNFIRIRRLQANRPPEDPRELSAIRHRYGVPLGASTLVYLEQATTINPNWVGYALEVVAVPTAYLPSFLGSPPIAFYTPVKLVELPTEANEDRDADGEPQAAERTSDGKPSAGETAQNAAASQAITISQVSGERLIADEVSPSEPVEMAILRQRVWAHDRSLEGFLEWSWMPGGTTEWVARGVAGKARTHLDRLLSLVATRTPPGPRPRFLPGELEMMVRKAIAKLWRPYSSPPTTTAVAFELFKGNMTEIALEKRLARRGHPYSSLVEEIRAQHKPLS